MKFNSALNLKTSMYSGAINYQNTQSLTQSVQLENDTTADSDSSFYIKMTNQDTVHKIITNLSNSQAKYVYIDTSFLKRHSSNRAGPLTKLINLSIATERFPDHWETALIAPIYKSGAANLATNYRPMSILPFFSKS